MALNVHPTYLRFQSSSNAAFSLIPCSLRFTSPNPFKSSRIPLDRFICRSSQVQQQEEQEQVPFTEPENSLIDALIGIQGRGRSASPQQLNVSCKFL